MDLLIAGGIFGLVVAVVVVLMNGGHGDSRRAAELLEDVTRTEVDRTTEGLIRTGGRQSRRQAGNRREELLEVIYRIHLLKSLEEQMWQAGLYMRVSQMLLIIVMMFGVGFALSKSILSEDSSAYAR